MRDDRPDRLLQILRICFALFVITSAFSIALAQITLGLSLVTFLIIAVRDKLNPFAGPAKPVYIFILLYIAWLLVASAMGKTPLRSMAICKEEWLFLAIPIGIYLFRNGAFGEKVLYGFAVATGIVSLYAITQFFTGSHWLHFTHGAFESTPVARPVGNFTHWLTFANYYAVAGALLCGYLMFGSYVAKRRLVVIASCAVLCLVAVVLTASRTPIAAIVIALVFCASIRPGKIRWLAIGGIGAVIALTLLLPTSRAKFGGLMQQDTSAQYEGSRVFIWTRSLDIVWKNPVFGVGQGNFRDEYVARLDPNIDEKRKLAHAHNDFINIAAIAGIPGALFFAGIWFAVIRLVGRSAFNLRLSIEKRRLALAALIGSVVFLITSLTEATFADEEVRQMLMFVWAVGLSVRYNEES